MQSIINRALCQMGIFMICTQTMIHFRPNDSYEKYLRLLVSVMLLVQIIEPFGQFFSPGMSESLTGRVAYFQESMDQSLEQMLQQLPVETTLEELSRKEVEQRMQELAEETGDVAYGNQELNQEEGSMGMEPVEPITIAP